MGLLSLLGWATAINYAADWCDRLVESSLDSANPPEPPTVIQSIQPETPVLTKSEFVEEIASTVNALEPEIPAPPTDKPSNSFRNIKQQATKNQMALQSVLRWRKRGGNKVELNELEKFLQHFQVLKLTEQITDRAVDLLGQYRLSHGLLIADALIAAALEYDEVFITKNQRDYRFIASLKLQPYP